ncbi:hypothetical protein FNF28_03934 [Cafeteria roenbergensis]|uniref:Partial AB-hydrolase lipase domain-containing protein n=1 Tax=Cafeteria roenbergensis TaxID=33653 RepID=A0A5A8DFK3_CAFRO|nr:hypothetical protein FNF28_03934 [Cafeteria roenbergensis]
MAEGAGLAVAHGRERPLLPRLTLLEQSMRAAARVFGAEATARLAGDLGGSSASPNLATGAGGSLAARVAAASYGIAARTYRVRTADGYLLRLVRLPRVESSRVAYFQHGLLDSASAWVASGAMYGLAVRAWAQGFDVFLGNLRGTEDSNDRDDAHAAASVQAQEGVAPAPSAQHSESERGDPRRGTGFSAENKAWPRSLGVPGSQSGWSFEAEAEADGGDDGGAAGLAGAAHGQDGPALVEGVHGDHGQVARLASPAGVTVPCAVPPRAELAKVEASGSPARGSSKGQTWTAAEPAGRALQPPAGVAIAPELGRGDGSDLRLGHTWLARSSTAFWQYSVDDHTLDVMAHIDAAVPDGLGSAAGEEPSKDAATRAASDASASGGAAGQGWGASAEPPAYSASLSDVAIVGVGHSMGGCLMLTHVLHSRALRRPHGMCGTVLLSPAGLHRDVGVLPRVVLSLTGLVALRLVPDGPFPMRSSKLQQVVAGIVQDLKRSQGTGDLIAAVASIFFGGTSGGFAFRRISLFDYPLGGTSVRVMAHGCQGMFGSEMTPFSFGEEENLRRYGTRAPESYRHDFGLLDVPMAFAAGELDALIPPANVRLLAAAVEAASPGKSGYEGFSQLGHLDFTLGVSDEVISHVLARLDSFTRAAADSRVKALPDFPLDLEAEIADDARLRSVASVARNRSHAGVSPSNWLPAAECARQYPFLNCYMKREVAFRGLDRRRARLWDAFDAKANAMPSLAGPSAGSPGAS